MRITFVLPWVNLSGGIRVVAIYAERLQAMGHKIVLVAPKHKPIANWYKFKSILKGRSWSHRITNLTHIQGRNLDHRTLSTYRPVVDDDLPDADIVIATWWGTAEWVNELSASKGKKVYFIQGHEIHVAEYAARSKATYRLPLHKIVISEWLRKTMQDEYGDADVDLVPNSVDHNQFFAAPRSKQINPTVGYLYSLVEIKGIDIAQRAIERLRLEFPRLKVVAFGAYALPAGARATACDEYIFDPPQQQIREIYARCDVWITCSRSEGFNLPAMEAMACYTPVVSTRTGWPAEAIIDGENGYLANIDDWQAVADKTARVLTMTGDAWLEMSRDAFATVSNSSWSASAASFEAILNKIHGDASGLNGSAALS